MKKTKSSRSVVGSYTAGRVKLLRKARAAGRSYQEIADSEGISSSSVRRILGVLRDSNR